MARVDFVSVNHCLRDGVTEGALATAIEKEGVYTWDRFGRFRCFKPPAPEAESVLSVLANVYARYSSDAPDDLDDGDDDSPDSLLRLCGWPKPKLPDFRSIEGSEPVVSMPPESTRPTPGAKLVRADLALIGGLLLFIKGELGNKRHPDFQTEDDLINVLELELSNLRLVGASQRTIIDKFSAAKKLLAEARGKARR